MSPVFISLPARPPSRRRIAAAHAVAAIALAATALGALSEAHAQCSAGAAAVAANAPGASFTAGYPNTTTGGVATYSAPGATYPGGVIPSTTGGTFTSGATAVGGMPGGAVIPAGYTGAGGTAGTMLGGSGAGTTGGTANLPTPPVPPAEGAPLDISNVVAGDGSETGPQVTVGGTVVNDGATPSPIDPAGNNVTDSVDPAQTLTYDTPLTVSPADAGANPAFPNYATPVNNDPVEDPQPAPVDSGPTQDMTDLGNAMGDGSGG
jgi:hypothetical protein